ncbi:exodeoxyribonuclease VII large subunit [Luteithermobacter gelatinilyticus]|uniref:exodeoxyribonuclease VII large subunit n=1 Tax=Luteithermobacter gelatinilyticus TaxID=2582913 RepID=UPI00110639E1|nr:exodeoxyribonuclease VII large subunit [Luteithermobacter gelatinilyticus]
MSDHSHFPGRPPQAARSNAPEYSVSELSLSLKRTVEENFGYVRVRGELSGLKRAASGHMYLALKDDKAVLDGVMWKGMAGRLTFRPEDGLEVICTGKLTTYPGRSKYQIVIDRMEPAGAGALMALLEERKKKLAAEGLFASERKKPIPYLPQVIGVVTSPTGAVIRDILHRLEDRFPRHVIVWPVLVQGEGAAAQVAEAIEGFNRLEEGGDIPRPDVLIVARGGGSLEDLWAFNEEVVVRAAAASEIPLISAVGHETDTTLIDYAADRRAPTPTAAAEIAVPVKADLVYTVQDLSVRLGRAQQRLLLDRRQRIEGLGRGLPRPQDLLSLSQQRFDELADRLPRALQHLSDKQHMRLDTLGARLRADMLVRDLRRHQQTLAEKTVRLPRALRHMCERQHMRLETLGERLRGDILVQDVGRERQKVTMLAERLQPAMTRLMQQQKSRLDSPVRLFDSLNYKRVLERGYAVIRDSRGKTLTNAARVSAGDVMDIEFRDGHVSAQAVSAPMPSEPVKPAKKTKNKTKPPSGDERQGRLL